MTHANAVDISSNGNSFAIAKLQELIILEINTPLSSAEEIEAAIKLRLPVASQLLDIAFSPDDRHIAASDMEGNLWLWSVDTGRLLAVLRGHTLRVPWLQFDADGKTLFSASWDGTIRRWNVQDVETPAHSILDEVTRAWGLSLKDAIRRTEH